ncbi:MAG: hypothetical protein WD534_14060 [Phycisphaeraceae bacterium]
MAGMAALGLAAAPALADETAVVEVNVTVAEYVSVEVDDNTIDLEIQDDTSLASTNGSVLWTANTPFDLSFELDGDIMPGTSFYVLVDPADLNDPDTDADGQWHRELDGTQSYVGGGLTPASSPVVLDPLTGNSVDVVYATKVYGSEMPDASTTIPSFDIIWTIAASD